MEALIECMWTGVFLGTIGSIRATQWPCIWIIMEVNLISFLPFVINKTKKTLILYFMAQSVGSLALLAGRVLWDCNTSTAVWVYVGLILKISMAPLHFWGPSLVLSLDNPSAFTFYTWQKIAPLFLLFQSVRGLCLSGLVLLNVGVAAYCIIGRKNLSILLFFSGIRHISWVVASLPRAGLVYFILYCISLGPILLQKAPNLSLLLMNLAGLPPLTGFFLKVSVLQGLQIRLGIFLLFFSLILLASYLRIFLYSTKSSRLTWSTIVICSLGIIL